MGAIHGQFLRGQYDFVEKSENINSLCEEVSVDAYAVGTNRERLLLDFVLEIDVIEVARFSISFSHDVLYRSMRFH